MLVFGACIPSVGELALKSTRDNPRCRVMGARWLMDGYGWLRVAMGCLMVMVENCWFMAWSMMVNGES